MDGTDRISPAQLYTDFVTATLAVRSPCHGLLFQLGWRFLDGAACEIALSRPSGRVYIVQPTGPIDDDPNVTDQKFPGNPTRSYRTQSSLRIVGEVTQWQGHSATMLAKMRENMQKARSLGIEAIN